MKGFKKIPLALVIMITWSCNENIYDDRHVLSESELGIALEGNAHFDQYIAGLIEHEARISEQISQLGDTNYDRLLESTKIYSKLDEFEMHASDEIVALYWEIVKEDEKRSLHFSALISQLDSEFIYKKQDLFEIIKKQLYDAYPNAPKARQKDKCEDVYWDVYIARLNDNYYRLGMSLDDSDMNAVRDASWAKVGCRLSR